MTDSPASASPRPITPSRAHGVQGAKITARQRQVLDFIEQQMRDRGYPPSVREIGEAIGLTSPSTVHSHLNTLQRLGYLRRDPTKPRAIEVRWDPNSGAVIERRPVRHVPARRRRRRRHRRAGRGERRRAAARARRLHRRGRAVHAAGAGDSMIDAGILDGDFVIAVQQPTANNGDIVVAGIPGDEATVKTYSKKGGRVTLTPANATMKPMVFDDDDVELYGRVVTVMRRL